MMKKQLFTALLIAGGILGMKGQQIGDGLPPHINNFNDLIKSGTYVGRNPIGGPDESYFGWQYLFSIRHYDQINNLQFQMATAYTNNDRLFFRKLPSSLPQPTSSAWVEIATRGTNTFTGDQNITGNESVTGNIGIGTMYPQTKFHLVSPSTKLLLSEGYKTIDANLVIEGSGTRTTDEGAALGFAIPANGGTWQQGRIIVTPENNNYGEASGKMFLQTRYNMNGGWYWNNGIVLRSSGNVGIGTDNPSEKLEVVGNTKINGNITANGNVTVNGNIKFGDFGQTLYWDWPGRNISVVQYGTSGQGKVMKFANSIGTGEGNTQGGFDFVNVNGTSILRIVENNVGIGNANPTEKLVVSGNARFTGNVGIGTQNPDAKLTVKGQIHAEEVKVDLNVPVPDYVFEKEYKLLSLEKVSEYVKANKHLPEVPSEAEFLKTGLNVGEINMLLLKKVEELTLYLIEEKQEIKALKKENEKLNEVLKRVELLEAKK